MAGPRLHYALLNNMWSRQPVLVPSLLLSTPSGQGCCLHISSKTRDCLSSVGGWRASKLAPGSSAASSSCSSTLAATCRTNESEAALTISGEPPRLQVCVLVAEIRQALDTALPEHLAGVPQAHLRGAQEHEPLLCPSVWWAGAVGRGCARCDQAHARRAAEQALHVPVHHGPHQCMCNHGLSFQSREVVASKRCAFRPPQRLTCLVRL